MKRFFLLGFFAVLAVVVTIVGVVVAASHGSLGSSVEDKDRGDFYYLCFLPSKDYFWRDVHVLLMRLQEPDTFNSYAVFSILSYDSGGPCASGDSQDDKANKRELAEHFYSRFGWEDVAYYLSILYGYGNFEMPFMASYAYDEQAMLDVREGLGDGEAIDTEESFRLLQEAADKGVIAAQLNLAYAYQVGHWGKNGALALEKDPEQSLAWLERAVSDEDAINKWYNFGGSKEHWVKFYIAYRYRYGEAYGIPINSDKAFMLFSELVNHPYKPYYANYRYPRAEAAIELALMHMERGGDDAQQQVAKLVKQAQTEIAKMSADDKHLFLHHNYEQKLAQLSDYWL